MTEEEIVALLVNEFGPAWRGQIVCGLRLADAVVPPQKVVVNDPYFSKTSFPVWLILHDSTPEDPTFFFGYIPNEKLYCLVEYGPGELPYILGRHNTLRATLEAA